VACESVPLFVSLLTRRLCTVLFQRFVSGDAIPGNTEAPKAGVSTPAGDANPEEIDLDMDDDEDDSKAPEADVDVQQKPVPAAVFGDAKKLLAEQQKQGDSAKKGALELLKAKKRRLA